MFDCRTSPGRRPDALAALDTERKAILKLFPDLRASQQPTARKERLRTTLGSQRRGMSPAARKAHGERMRAYWANRRAEKDGTAASPREIAADASPTGANQALAARG